MRGELKEISSTDIDLISYNPPEPHCFSFPLRAMIGPEGEKGSESFDFQVCTPQWLQTNLAKKEPLFGRHLLIVAEYDKELIEAKIRRLCERTLGSDWSEVASKLARYGYWEFEDYQTGI